MRRQRGLSEVFPRGHFGDDVKSLATDVISVSKYSLAAHVVTARLCFAIEQKKMNS